MIKRIKKFAKFFVMISCLSILSYVVVQQNYRQSANDPQIQIAEDLADGLASGQQKAEGLTLSAVDIGKSLSVFRIVLDENGEIVASEASLDGQPAIPPKGVLDDVRTSGENRVTWQPQPGVRSAIVVEHYSGQSSGFVVVGRSLKQVEIREDKLTKMFFTGWIGTIVATFAVGLIF